jgi:hypothetical protein
MAAYDPSEAPVYARLARGECASFRQGGCRGRDVCPVQTGEECSYFEVYVLPLLKNPDCAARYRREAKIARVTEQVRKEVTPRKAASRTAPTTKALPDVLPPLLTPAAVPVLAAVPAPVSTAASTTQAAPAPTPHITPAPAAPVAQLTRTTTRRRATVDLGNQMALDFSF